MKKRVVAFIVMLLMSVLASEALFADTDNEIMNYSNGRAGYSTAILTEPDKIPILKIQPREGSKLEYMSFELWLRNGYWDIESFGHNGIRDYGSVDKDGVFTPDFSATGYLTGKQSIGGVKYKMEMGDRDNVAVVTLDDYAYVSQYDALYIPILAEITGDNPYIEIYCYEPSDLTVDGYYYFTGSGGASTQVKPGAPKDFSRTVNLSELSIQELAVGAMVSGTLTVKAPAGYQWINVEQIQIAGKNTSGTEITKRSFATEGQNAVADPAVLLLNLTMYSPANGGTRTFVLSNLQLEALPGNENYGPTMLSVYGCNMEQETVKVAERVRMDYTLRAADSQNLPMLISGNNPADTTADSIRTLKVTMEEVTPGRWRAGNRTTFTLPEGVTAKAVMINTTNLLTDLPQDTVIRRVDENAHAINNGDNGTWTLAANGLTIQNAKTASGRTAKLELTFYVTASQNYKGTVYLTAGGSGLLPETSVAIAQAVQRLATGPLVLTIGSKEMKLGNQTMTMDVAPYIENGYTMVPVSFVARALGLPSDGVRWDGDAQTVTIKTGTKEVVLTIGSKEMKINGVAVDIPIAPLIRDGRTFLPFRVLGEQVLGVAVGWDGASQTATFY